MELQVSKKADWTGKDIYVGIDEHKKSWGICVLTDHFEHKVFSQPPGPKVLASYLERNFPGASCHSAYEAGFCGFWISHELSKMGIDNVVVNPSDVPTTAKEKRHPIKKAWIAAAQSILDGQPVLNELLGFEQSYAQHSE